MESNALRDKAIKAIKETSFYLQRDERLLSMIQTRPDWCVSRQRVWGVPLPIFINKKTQQPLKDKKSSIILLIFLKRRVDCWFTDDASRFLGKSIMQMNLKN